LKEFRFVSYFQRVRIQNHYSEVLALDDELQKFMDNLPPHFSFSPDTSLDNLEGYSYIPLHRYLLTTEIMFVRISLHRPYILRRSNSDRYAPSRRACFNCAIMDYEVRQAYRRSQSKEVLRMVGNSYREFQTAMAAGIFLVLEPNGRDAQKMHIILDSFIKDHEDAEGEMLDETTRREVKIVEFLKAKAVQNSQNGAARSFVLEHNGKGPDRVLDAQASANLLLNLQQSRNPISHGRSASESSMVMSPALRNLYPTLLSKNAAATTGNTPTSLPVASDFGLGPGMIGPLPQSPTLQRIQAQVANARHSPAASGSPSADDDMAAQNMLDHWCNAVTNPPPLQLDALNEDTSLSSGQWGTFPNAPGGGLTDWWTAPYYPNDMSLGNGINGVEGADYNYWENLVNTIRGGPLQ
jgi:hypothetical protein